MAVTFLTNVDQEELETKIDNVAESVENYTETDPTVPAWAKAANKPTYTASEVGALSEDSLPMAINTALAQAKASGEFKGDKGDTGATGAQGEPGKDGADGKDGASVTVKFVSESTADGGSNVVTFSDGKTITIKNGSTGAKGLDATPVTPLFVNTIEECTDTTKPYVLPDGYIYAYTNVSGKLYTNQLPISKDKDGNVYNGTGYKKGVRYSTSGKTEVEHNLAYLSGYIPVKAGDVVRLENVEMKKTEGDGNLCSVTFFSNYDVAYGTPSQVTNIPEAVWNDNDTLVQFTSTYNGYFRLTTRYIGSDSIVTVNEKIEEGTTLKWTNTGHAFVPVDYEDRIIDVEEANAKNEEHIEAHEIRIANLESGAANGIPDYVIAEAEEVIDKVIAAQGSRTFTFAAITDMHYGNASYTNGLIHACQAMQYIDSRIRLDAVSVLGDYIDGFTGTDYNNAIGDFKDINAELNNLRFAPNLRMHGNHDHYEPSSPILHRYITAYSDDVVWGSKLGGYFYRDFEDFKLRIICLNTAEENKDGLSCSVAQYNWFVNVLDLSSKEDAAEWQTLILSHHPLDWFISVEGGYVFWQILNAYLSGTSWTNTQGTAISCDFSGKNSAKIVGNIHGHIHNLLTRKIAAGRPNGTEDTINVVRIATPEACFGRPNSYNDSWEYNPFGEDTSYPKTQGTAEDTAFCIYCVDLDAHTVKAICYGAGYDREISY